MLSSAGCGRFGFDLGEKSASGGRPHSGIDGGFGVGDGSVSRIDAACARCGDGSLAASDAAKDASGDAAGVSITAPDVTWNTDTNLSFDNTPGHVCAEGGDMVSFSVVSLAADAASLDHAPGAGCLSQGDEVLLISMRATGTSNVNAGRFEILEVERVDGSTVRFARPKKNAYGDGASDNEIGTGTDQHRVVLQRLPTYGNATLSMGATLRTYAWDGLRGGVLAMRVEGTLRIDGRIDVSGTGYAGGAATLPVATTGQQGESIAGPGAAAVVASAGGGGGGLGDSMGCRQDGAGGGGAGHSAAGSAAFVMSCGAVGVGAGGAELGDATRLLMGSGGGAGGTDNVRTDNPPGGEGGTGGGSVLLIANTIAGSGSIDAHGMNGQGDAPGVECDGGSNVSCWDHCGPGGGGAGGTLRIEATSVATSVTLSVAGGKGGNGNDALSGNGGDASPGRTVILSANGPP